MTYFSNPIFLLFLTLGVYATGVSLTKKYKWIIFNPIILSMTVIITYLSVLQISVAQYGAAGQFIEFFLKPSVVALAIPLYTQWHRIKKQLFPILISQFVGCVVGLSSAVLIAYVCGADRDIILSMAPKSVTNPIALEVSRTIGGIPSITAFSVMFAGIFGGMIGFKFMAFCGITNPMSQGIAQGTSAHAIGTMSAMNISEKYGAFSTVGMIVNGVLTAVLAPYLLKLMMPYL